MDGEIWTVITVAAVAFAFGAGAIAAAYFHVIWAVALLVLLAMACSMLATVCWCALVDEQTRRGR